uniref:Homeodomain interacting protein kinase 4 n=1 Tax=Anas platyrhynchos TaxID=8839 RepID=A0A8B9SH90_ANAPL
EVCVGATEPWPGIGSPGEHRVGKGSFGEVARSCRRSTGEMVAIKILRNEGNQGQSGTVLTPLSHHQPRARLIGPGLSAPSGPHYLQCH